MVLVLGPVEHSFEKDLSKLKVSGEVYFGKDNFVGNTMHKIYANFNKGETVLIDCLKEVDDENFNKLKILWEIISSNHKYFSSPYTTVEETNKATETTEKFTKKFPIFFPNKSITRKMHLLSFVIPKIIREDTSNHNICFKFLKVEQAGERFHNVWNTLTRTKFFAVKDKRQKLLFTFKEYENLIYVMQTNK